MPDSKRLKLCIILQSHFAAKMGGAQFQARIIVEELVKRTEYDIVYLANNVSSDYEPEGYAVQQISDISSGISRFTAFADGRALNRLLEEIRPDVIYQNALTPHTGFAARYAKRSDAKFIFHIASDFDVLPRKVFGATWKRKLMEMLEKKFAIYGLNKRFKVIAQTQLQSTLLQKHYGRKANLVLQNLLETPREQISKSTEQLVVAWVANFKPVKQPELFLRLAQQFSDRSNVRFVMAGRPAYEMNYDDLHKGIKAQKNLEFLGEVTVDRVNELLAEAHLLVNTSVTEGYSNTYVQAWMRQVPVVSLNADVDGLLENEELGLLGKSFSGLVESIRRLLDEPDLREAMARNAREYSFKHNSLDNIEDLIDLIEN